MNQAIFRSYDIRGVYGKDIDEQLFERIGNAFAQYVKKDILIARDARLSGESLLNSFMNGALKAEKTAMNIGEIPLSLAVHWATSQNFELAYVTASHLPKEWNGVKFYHANGHGFMEEENFAIRDLVENGRFFSGVRGVPVREEINDVKNLYINNLVSKVKGSEKKKLRILVDCGNGTAGIVAKELFERTNFSVDTIFEQPDGNFPNRLSDPNEDQLTEMKNKIKKYDAGFAYDGDADRFVAVTKNGVKLSPEQVAFVILPELAKSRKGPIVANVECSMLVEDIAKEIGTDVIRVKVGHTFLMDAVAKHNAMFGLEMTGHYVVPHITNFDDAISTSLFFAYALQKTGKQLDDILKEIPPYYFKRINFSCADEKKFGAIESLKARLSKEYEINDLDGIRIDFGDSWILVRVSNTSPTIRLTVEAKTKEKFDELAEKFTKIIEEEVK